MYDDRPVPEFDSPEEAREHARQLIQFFGEEFQRSGYKDVRYVLIAFNCAVDFGVRIPRWLAQYQAIINSKILQIQDGENLDQREKAEEIYSQVFRFDKDSTRKKDRRFEYLIWGKNIEEWRTTNRRRSGKMPSYAQAFRTLSMEENDATVTERFLKEAHQFYRRWKKSNPNTPQW